MQARYYDPDLGRFLQADSLPVSSFTTQGINRYAYVNNDPVNGSDPSGFTPLFVGGVALLGLGLGLSIYVVFHGGTVGGLITVLGGLLMGIGMSMMFIIGLVGILAELAAVWAALLALLTAVLGTCATAAFRLSQGNPGGSAKQLLWNIARGLNSLVLWLRK